MYSLYSDGFKGDLYLLVKMLLPGVVKTVYNLNSKQLVKVFSQVRILTNSILILHYHNSVISVIDDAILLLHSPNWCYVNSFCFDNLELCTDLHIYAHL